MRSSTILVAALGLVFPLTAASEPSVALLEITPQPDPAWRDHDLQMLENFRQGLTSRSSLRAVPAEVVENFFKETPAAAVPALINRAREHLKRGKGFSERLKPNEAIKEFREALRILRAIFPFLPSLSELEEAHLQLGMTYQALGKERQANRAYRMVLLLNPNRILDENMFNPVVVEYFSGMREQLLTTLQGSMSLLSRPPGARVFMNGRAVGYTPITIPGVYPGEHYFSMEQDGYKTWFGVLRVKPGGLEKKEIFLVEGRCIRWVRLRDQMGQAGIGRVPARDAEMFASALGADWVLLAAVSHLGGRTMMELGIFESGGKEVSPLGVFPADEGSLERVAARVEGWIQGDRRMPHKTLVKRTISPVEKRNDLIPKQPPPPPPDGSSRWYTQWWFWTAVGVVVAGATAGTWYWLTRESGIQVQVYR